MRSEQTNELAGALALAQGAIKAAEKSGRNPHLNSTYTTLAGVWDACRQPLAANGLAVTQLVTGDGGVYSVETILMHSSGQWVSSSIAVPAANGQRGVNELQSLGSALTYIRRYALSAIIGVVSDDDDDGNQATKKPASEKRPAAEKQESATPKPATVQYANLEFPTYNHFETWAAGYYGLEISDIRAALRNDGLKFTADSARIEQFKDCLAAAAMEKLAQTGE